jgi:putative alpha-1,2-mannosidase
MSAWYIFSALGFYPVTPGTPEYAVGTPKYSRATLHLSNGKQFVLSATDVSASNLYIQSVTLNGKPMNSFLLKHSEIEQGGTLVFHMGAQPNLAWPALADAATTKGM